jgi:hypothetical protein
MRSKNLFIQMRKGLYDHIYEDSENSLQTIVGSLAWNDSIYRTFNEGLRLAQSEARRQRLPSSLIDYIHRAHTAYVVISLRKLYDDKKQGTRSVNSLRTITQQILDNAHLFTRENYVTFDDIPYDDSEKLDWRTRAIVQARHSQFDSLCGIKISTPRKKADILDANIAKTLHDLTRLKPEIERFSNKFLAHASAKKNRPDEDLTLQKLTLGRIQTQYRNVIWSTQQIAKFLCEAFLSQVPTPQFDVLMNWENGLFDDAIKRKLRKYWDKRMSWWRKWTDHYRQGYRIFTSPEA